jgi:Zn-finger nucleic acid-binding protein
MPKYPWFVVEARVYQCPVCGAFARQLERSCRHCTTQLATLRCARCYDLNYPDDLHCRGCGSELGLEPIPELCDLPCPDCKVPLQAFRAGSGCLHACERCGGQLVDHALLRELLEARETLGSAVLSSAGAPRSNPLSDPVRYRACPVCRQMMNRKNFAGTSGVILDVCTLHGSFFDPGELPRILEFVRRGGLVKARATLEAQRRRPERPSMARLVPDAPTSTVTFVDAVDFVDLLDFVVELLTAHR